MDETQDNDNLGTVAEPTPVGRGTAGFWDFGGEREPLMHRIHAYPAKFSAFITPRRTITPANEVSASTEWMESYPDTKTRFSSAP